MCENDVEGVETVLIVTHVTQVERVESVKYYVLFSVYQASLPFKGEGYLFESLLFCGFCCSPPVSLRRQLC